MILKISADFLENKQVYIVFTLIDVFVINNISIYFSIILIYLELSNLFISKRVKYSKTLNLI